MCNHAEVPLLERVKLTFTFFLTYRDPERSAKVDCLLFTSRGVVQPLIFRIGTALRRRLRRVSIKIQILSV